jgi:hypothetical protein
MLQHLTLPDAGALPPIPGRRIAQTARRSAAATHSFRNPPALLAAVGLEPNLLCPRARRFEMFSRSVGILIGAWLPMLAVTLPIGPVHTANALIAGILATVLSLAALADDRARIATAVVGAWVALCPFIFTSTLIEEVLTVSWGVTIFVSMIGPFSEAPRVEIVGVPQTRKPPVEEEEPALRRAA